MCCLTPIDYMGGDGPVVLRVHGGRWILNPVRIDCWDVGKQAKNGFISKPSISICALKRFLFEFCVGCLVQHSKRFIFFHYKLFGYKFPLKICPCNFWVTIHVVWCFFVVFLLRVVWLSSGLLDLGSFTSIAGGTTTSTCLECGGNRRHPSPKLDPPFHGRRQSAELFMICFFLQPPWFFQKSGGGIFQKQLENAWWYTWRILWKDDAKKQNTRGIDAARGFWFASICFDDTANQTHKVVWKVIILPGSK